MRTEGAKKYEYNGFEFFLWNDYIKKVKEIPKTNTFVYKVGVGDRLDTISIKVYGTYSLWWVIALYNNKKHCLDLEVGEILYCPTYDALKQIL